MVNLDTADIQILSVLREDGRKSLRDIASKVGLSAPAVSSRVKRLEDLKIIESYGVKISSQVFALSLEALIYVQVANADEDKFLEYARSLLCVNSLYKIASDYSYIIKASFENTAKLNNFVTNLQTNYGKCKVELILKREIEDRSSLSFTDFDK